MIQNVPGAKLTIGPNPFQERVANPSLAKNLNIGQETKDKETEMKKVSEGFEEIFARHLLSTMRQSVPKSSLFGKGFGADFYTSMFDEQIAKKITSTGKLGISNMVYNFLKRAEEKKGKISVESHKMFPLNPQPKEFQLEQPKPLSLPGKQPISENLSSQNNLEKFESIIQEAAETFDVDSNLVKAVITKESGGNAQAVSTKGAKGLMQLIDGTAKEMGVVNVFDTKQNIYGGTRYLREMLDLHNGDVELALAAYNAGPGNVQRYGGIPPFQETRNYVNSVMSMYKKMQNT